MLRNYFKTSIRFLLKNKTYSLINIVGLAMGTLCCIYIILFVADQYSYDKQHKEAKNIYRVTTDLKINGEKHHLASASPAILPAMKKDFAEIVQSTRVAPNVGIRKMLMNYKEKSFYEENALYVDSTFFEVFTYHFIYGSPAKALMEPYELVLKQSESEKVFGNINPVGKTISLEDARGKHEYKVTGVVDESLGKSIIQASMFITMRSGGIGDFITYNNMFAGNNFVFSYIKLRPDASAEALEKKLPAFIQKYGGQQMKEIGMEKQLNLQPLTAIHVSGGYELEMGTPVSKSFLNILILIACLIQVVACINFMNLSTARASKRAKEVGVRKVIGAGKNALIKQFLAESMILSLLGILIALPLLILAMPYLNQITSADIHLTLFSDFRLWIFLMVLVLFTGLLAGSYPAFYLSAFQAIKVIKGNFSNQVSALGIRRTLVIFQFVLSVVLISSIIIIYSQLNYIKNKDLGFSKEQKLIFTFYTGAEQSKMAAISHDLHSFSEVNQISLTDNYPGQFDMNDYNVYLPGGDNAHAVDAQNMNSDEFYVKSIGITLLNGRDFRKDDTGRVLINETLCHRLGLNVNKAPGTRLYSQFQPNPPVFAEIVGVMKDFNYNSLHTEIKPFMVKYTNNNFDLSYMILSVNSNNYKNILSKIESVWRRDLPTTPFEYMFLDQEVQKQYQTEITLGNIINSFTLMAILISALGLYGLAAFSAEQRSKEIGIRKVLGANASGIVGLLSKDFLKLVFVAIIIAIPITWWSMNKWLDGFNYKIAITWWMFALAGLIVTIVALVTVSSQAIKAAIANPVKSLKSE